QGPPLGATGGRRGAGARGGAGRPAGASGGGGRYGWGGGEGECAWRRSPQVSQKSVAVEWCPEGQLGMGPSYPGPGAPWVPVPSPGRVRTVRVELVSRVISSTLSTPG
ncbi:hypothetical protein Q7689_34880, partial [Nocardiopsis tropica]|nr:hypothetical protein [Nocardiopsis tropica]